MELILYTSNSTGVASNCLYPNRAVITDSAGLVAAGKFDQVFAKYKDNYRSVLSECRLSGKILSSWICI